MKLSHRLTKFYVAPLALSSFYFFSNSDENEAIYPRSFRILPFFVASRLFFHRGNDLKSFIVKPYHFFNLSGNFVYTRYQSKAIHVRAKRKKVSSSKKRRLFI